MLRNRKVWGVLGVLLALVVVGYGQQPGVPVQPQPDPVAELTVYPQKLSSMLSQVIRRFERVLEGAQINISNAAMWVGSPSPGQPSGVIIVAPPAKMDLRPGAIVGLIGIHNVRLGTVALPTGYYVAKLSPEKEKNRLILLGWVGKQEGVWDIKLTSPEELTPFLATPPRVHMSIGLQDAVPPNYPSIMVKICIGWKRANCDCIGISIEW